MDAICQIENSFYRPFRPIAVAPHHFACIIRIHGNFHKRKMSVTLFAEYFANADHPSRISLICVHVCALCVFMFYFFLSGRMMCVADCVLSFRFRCRYPTLCGTKHVVETESYEECAFVVLKWFMVFVWCKNGAFGPFYLFALHAHNWQRIGTEKNICNQFIVWSLITTDWFTMEISFFLLRKSFDLHVDRMIKASSTSLGCPS